MVDNSSRMAHIWLRIMKTAIVAYKMTANPNVPINEKIDPFKSVEPNFNKKHKCATTVLKWPKKVNMVNMMWVVRSNLPADLADGQMHSQISIRLAVINGSIFGFEMHFQNDKWMFGSGSWYHHAGNQTKSRYRQLKHFL